MQFDAWRDSPCLVIDDNSSSLQDAFRTCDIDPCEMSLRVAPHTEKNRNAQLLGKKIHWRTISVLCRPKNRQRFDAAMREDVKSESTAH